PFGATLMCMSLSVAAISASASPVMLPCRPLSRLPRLTGLQLSQHAREVVGQQLRDVQPQPREDLALDHALGVRRDANVLTLAQPKPVNGLVEHSPDNVFAHAIAAIDAQFIVQIIGGG